MYPFDHQNSGSFFSSPNFIKSSPLTISNCTKYNFAKITKHQKGSLLGFYLSRELCVKSLKNMNSIKSLINSLIFSFQIQLTQTSFIILITLTFIIEVAPWRLHRRLAPPPTPLEIIQTLTLLMKRMMSLSTTM